MLIAPRLKSTFKEILYQENFLMTLPKPNLMQYWIARALGPLIFPLLNDIGKVKTTTEIIDKNIKSHSMF